MQVQNASTSSNARVIVGNYSANNNCRWRLEKYSNPPVGMYLFDTASESVVADTHAGTTAPVQYVAPQETRTPLVPVQYSNYTIEQTFTCTSSNTSKATVNASAAVTGVSPGTVTITAKKYCGSTVGYKTASYTLIVNTLSSGEYFIENRHYEEFVQIDDNDAPSYNNNGGIIEIWPFDGGEYQKWVFTHVGDGYYKISSKKNGFAITVPQGNETTDNVDLILSPYTGLDRQKWTIELTSHGSYKIKAKSSINYTSKDLVMDMEMDPFYTDGLNIRQREYVDNETYRDEWLIYNDSILFSQTVLATSSASNINQHIKNSYNFNCNITGFINDELSENEFKKQMGEVVSFCIITHGGEIENKLQLSDGDIFWLSELDAMNDDTFNGLQIAILPCCYSGRTGGASFVDSLRDKGVDVVIGFQGSIEQTTTMYWTEQFIDYLTQGFTVNASITSANSDLLLEFGGTSYEAVITLITNGIYTSTSDLTVTIFD